MWKENERIEARMDTFEYIKMFYNVKRRHGFTHQQPPVEYEKWYNKKLVSVY